MQSNWPYHHIYICTASFESCFPSCDHITIVSPFSYKQMQLPLSKRTDLFSCFLHLTCSATSNELLTFCAGDKREHILKSLSSGPAGCVASGSFTCSALRAIQDIFMLYYCVGAFGQPSIICVVQVVVALVSKEPPCQRSQSPRSGHGEV